MQKVGSYGRARTSTVARAESRAELAMSGAADEIFARAGDWVAITAPARFLWLRKHRPSCSTARQASA